MGSKFHEVRMTNASAWFALAGVLGGVTLTGVIGLVTAGLTHRWGEQARVGTDREQRIRAIRDQRREVCHKYLVATNSFWQALDQLYQKACRDEEVDPVEHLRMANTALQDAYVYLTISCGADVRQLAHSYNESLYALRPAAQAADETAWSELGDETSGARENLRKAIRAELGVED